MSKNPLALQKAAHFSSYLNPTNSNKHFSNGYVVIPDETNESHFLSNAFDLINLTNVGRSKSGNMIGGCWGNLWEIEKIECGWKCTLLGPSTEYALRLLL